MEPQDASSGFRVMWFVSMCLTWRMEYDDDLANCIELSIWLNQHGTYTEGSGSVPVCMTSQDSSQMLQEATPDEPSAKNSEYPRSPDIWHIHTGFKYLISQLNLLCENKLLPLFKKISQWMSKMIISNLLAIGRQCHSFHRTVRMFSNYP